MDYKGINYLRKKLIAKRSRTLKRYKFYEMKNLTSDLHISTPPQLIGWMTSLGWCAKSVDSLADRLMFRGFENDNLNLNNIFSMNNPDILFDSAILCSLICSCSFLYISKGNDDIPQIQVIDGSNATGIIDSFTGLLKEGYAVLSRDEYGNPIEEAWFIPGQTIFYKGNRARTYKYNVDYPLLVPLIFRPDAIRPFGHSRISRACMDIMGSAIRTIKRSEISAEFFSFPQRYITGLSEDAEMADKWKATMSSLLSFTKDEDGDSPQVGQFSQQAMSPHTEQLRMFASLFAGETGLTLDDLGFATDNPSSAEAIKASHENLRLTAKKAQRTFGSGFLNAGYLAACVRDNIAYKRNVLYLTIPKWEPVFEPDAATLSVIGDGAIKINQAIPGYFDKNNLRDLTGIKSSEE